MNGDQQSKIPKNKFHGYRDDSDEDYEDVEDVGSGVEDDAPESFQALNRSEPPWATFPDLLRVPTSTANNNSATEDDSPESLSFAAASSFRSNDLINQAISSGYRSVTANPVPSSSSFNNNNNHVPFVGGIPKNRLAHPDVSHVNQSNSVSASSPRNYRNYSISSRQGSGSSSNDPSGVSSSSTLSSSRPLPALPVNSQTYNSSGRHHPPQQSGSSDIDYTNRTSHHSNRSSINSLNLSSALYSSSQSSSTPSSLAHSLAPITSALTRVQSSVDALSRQINERLDALEDRLNIASNDICTVNLSGSPPESLKSFVNEQKREMHNERRTFLLSFSEALKNAAESSRSSSSDASSTSKLNGL